eukprot:6196966-Pleurochrysis_carterae.AAC.1
MPHACSQEIRQRLHSHRPTLSQPQARTDFVARASFLKTLWSGKSDAVLVETLTRAAGAWYKKK